MVEIHFFWKIKIFVGLQKAPPPAELISGASPKAQKLWVSYVKLWEDGTYRGQIVDSTELSAQPRVQTQQPLGAVQHRQQLTLFVLVRPKSALLLVARAEAALRLILPANKAHGVGNVDGGKFLLDGRVVEVALKQIPLREQIFTEF